MNNMKLLLDQVTTFCNDIGMRLSESKCAYMVIEKGTLLGKKEPIIINNVKMKPMEKCESYKYLDQDENISYVGPVNKERVIKEYKNCVRMIWKSELSSYNKYIAHNTFAVPILIPTFGLLNWTIKGIEYIGFSTRKILCMTYNFHRNSDIDQLYLQRTTGGRGLKSIKIAYGTRVITARQHLIRSKNNNKYLENVIKHEDNNLMRVGKELPESMNIDDNNQLKPQMISKKYLQAILEVKSISFKNKPLHCYIHRKIAEDNKVDQKLSNNWTNN